MSPVATAAMWGALAASPLLIGAWLALVRPQRDRNVGRVAAFGAGALVSAVSFELVQSAVVRGDPALLAVALAAGAIAYYTGDRVLQRDGADQPKASARGGALLFGALLDGLPESFILGLSVVAGGEIGLAFFFAVVISNFPEGMTSAVELVRGGISRARILGLWLGVVVVSTATAALGAVTAVSTARAGSYAQAFAAGALLTMLMDDLIPEARERGSLGAGLFGVLGFAVAFALHQQGL